MTYVAPGYRLIHKGLISADGAQISALCFDPPRQIDIDEAYWILSKWLHDEVSCPDCRRLLELPDEPSRGSILRNNVAVCLSLSFQFIDALYWNEEIRQSGEEKINPDPDGQLAGGFLRLTNSFDEFMKPLKDMMEKHEKEFGWADVVTEPTNVEK